MLHVEVNAALCPNMRPPTFGASDPRSGHVIGSRANMRSRCYWSGLDFPRHLVPFTPETMGAMVARAGGRVER